MLAFRRLTACESPIEELMLTALLEAFNNFDDWKMPVVSASQFLAGDFPGHNIVLACQVPIGNYRVDFAMKVRGAEPPYQLIIECDGYDFHEKTRTQAARDKKRDRELQAKGLRVFRFTGSEIWRDPFGCAWEILSMVEWDLFNTLPDVAR
jgi:very-short-patch-repair endonuclease